MFDAHGKRLLAGFRLVAPDDPHPAADIHLFGQGDFRRHDQRHLYEFACRKPEVRPHLGAA